MENEPGYPSLTEGWGRPQLDQTLVLTGNSHVLWVQDIPREDGLSTGSVAEYPIKVKDSGRTLRITLAWTDTPALPNAASASVNDLDLKVEAPDGTIYLGNQILDGLSLPGGTPDAANNVEQVILPAPPPGQYVLRVRGADVPMPAQGFALVATGSFSGLPQLIPPRPIPPKCRPCKKRQSN
jgi:hypothetical protein